MKNILKPLMLGLFILIFALPESFGQYDNHLLLKKSFRNKMQFFTGDSIIFMRDGFNTPRRALIGGIGEDHLLIGREEIKIKDISGVVKVRALHFKAAGATMKIAGPGLIFLDGLNSLIRNFTPLFSYRVAIVGGLIFGSGFILPHLQTKVYYMDKGYYLRIVPADPGTLWKNEGTKYLPSS